MYLRCWILTRQYSAERSGDFFRSFAVRDSLESLLTKRHTYCCWSAPVFTCCRDPLGTNTKAGLIRTFILSVPKYVEQPMLLYRTSCRRVLLVRGFRQARTTRTGCVKNSYIIPSVPQEVEPWNMAGTISCADPTARFPCFIYLNLFKCI